MHKFIRKFRFAIAAVLASFVGLLVANPAGATPPPDPTDGAMTDIQTSITTWVSTYGLPALVVLLTLGLVIGILVRFARKGASKVAG